MASRSITCEPRRAKLKRACHGGSRFRNGTSTDAQMRAKYSIVNTTTENEFEGVQLRTIRRRDRRHRLGDEGRDVEHDQGDEDRVEDLAGLVVAVAGFEDFIDAAAKRIGLATALPEAQGYRPFCRAPVSQSRTARSQANMAARRFVAFDGWLDLFLHGPLHPRYATRHGRWFAIIAARRPLSQGAGRPRESIVNGRQFQVQGGERLVLRLACMSGRIGYVAFRIVIGIESRASVARRRFMRRRPAAHR